MICVCERKSNLNVKEDMQRLNVAYQIAKMHVSKELHRQKSLLKEGVLRKKRENNSLLTFGTRNEKG